MIDYTALETARKALNIRKSALATSVGMPPRRLGDILKGRIDARVSELEAIAAHLGLTVRIAPRMRYISLKELGEMDKGGVARVVLDYLQGTVSIGSE